VRKKIRERGSAGACFFASIPFIAGYREKGIGFSQSGGDALRI